MPLFGPTTPVAIGQGTGDINRTAMRLNRMARTMLRRSHLAHLAVPDTFIWSAGIEDTFIADPWPATGRILDEYELTGHYRHWREDLRRMADLGVKVSRYGLPWYRINPAPGQWDWTWTDAALEELLALGIEPIVDLVHYGVPRWLENAFLNPAFPECMAEFARRVAERYRHRIYAYTPLNEPRITAWYCGKLGWWPPARRGWRGFVAVMLALARGIVLTVEALQQVDPEIVPVHVDATDLYETTEAHLEPTTRQRQEIVFLALDLISGRMVGGHSLYEWILDHGAQAEDLEWLRARAVDLPLIGINLYPMYSRKVLTRTSHGLRVRMPYSSAEIVGRLAEMYSHRYGCPVFISETASQGSVQRREAWLTESVAAVRSAREKGVPLVGYTWWPMLAIVTWAYRQGTLPAARYLRQMGLWDLKADAAGDLHREATPLVEQFRELVLNGTGAVGQLRLRTEGKKVHV